MRKQILSVSLSLVCLNFGLHGQATQQLTNQNTSGVVWLQQSGEYIALCHQAFNLGKSALDQAMASNDGQPFAVVVDLDETMIDNSPYAAWLIEAGKVYEPKTWSRWVRRAEAKAIPGALEFAQYVTERGVTLFYVSNRSDENFEATQKNLIALGFPNVQAQTLRLKTDTSNKAPRFAAIEAEGYRVVLAVGDNVNDFPELGTWHESNDVRNQQVAAAADSFGTRFVVLPNPSYGDWEAGLADGYNGFSDAEKIAIRLNNLKAWDGE